MLRKVLWTGLYGAFGTAATKDQEPGTATVRRPAAPTGPQHAPRSKGGPSPFVVAGAAFGAGTLLAKLIDWRGHAHPRR